MRERLYKDLRSKTHVLIVMKFYGLESLFPSKWVEDSAPQETLEQKPTEQKEFAIKRAKAAAAAEEDTSDPLQIKGKIK